MATTTIGQLLLRMEVDGDRTVMSALQRYIRTTERASGQNKKFNLISGNTNTILGTMTSVLGGVVAGFSALKIIDSISRSLGFFVDKLKEGVSRGIEYNSNIEYMNAAIKALLGSEDKAVKLTNDLVELAAETPFSIEHYSKATKTLLGYGVASEDIIPTIKMLGEVSIGNASAFDRLALAYGQTTAKGKLQAEEVRQMVNQGFNPLKFIVEETGIEMTDLASKMRKGEITTEMVTDAFELATKEGSRFNGIMEELSKTYKGQKEKIEEYGDIFWGKVTKPLYDLMASRVLPLVLKGIQDLTLQVDVLYGTIEETTPALKDFIKAFKSGNVLDLFDALKKLIPEADMKDISKSTVIVVKFRDALKKLKDVSVDIFEYLKENGLKAFDFWRNEVKKEIFPIIKKMVDKIDELDFTHASKSLDNLRESIQETTPLLKGFGKAIIENIVEAAKTGWNEMASFVDNLPLRVQSSLEMLNLFVQSVRFSLALLTGDFDTVKDSLNEMAKSNYIILSNMKKFTLDSFNNMGSGVLSTMSVMAYNTDTKFGIITSNALNALNYLVFEADNKWQTLQVITAVTWNKIHKTITNVFSSINNTGTSVSSSLVSFIGQQWGRLKGTTSRDWGTIKNTITSFISSAKQTSTNIIVSLIATMIGQWRNLKQRTIGAFNAIKQTIVNAIISAKNSSVKLFISFVYAIARQFNNAKSKAKGFRSAIKGIMNFSLWQSGRNLIQSLINGISSKLPSLRSMVSYGASIIKSFLGFGSPTKEGPGSTANEWIPNLLEMFIEDFHRYRNRVGNAANLVARAISQNINGIVSVRPQISTPASFSNTGVSPIGINTTGQSRAIEVNIYTDNFTRGRTIGKELVKELNMRGVLTHK